MEEKIAELQLTGWNVAIPLMYADYDERLLHKYYINKLTQKKEVLVLGSSRVRKIQSQRFKGKTFQNHAAAGATLEDFMAIYEMYHQKKMKPDLVIIGLDHWILEKNNGLIHWKSIAKEYFQAIRRLGLTVDSQVKTEFFEHQMQKYREILSPAYFQDSFKKLITFGVQKTRYYATRKTLIMDDNAWIQLFDGSAGYPKTIVTRTVEEVHKIVTTKDDGVSPLTNIDIGLATSLDIFITSLQEENIKVIFILVPVHPITYQRWVKNKKGIIKAEKYFRELASRKKIIILGSYNPAQCQCNKNEFYDWVHVKSNCLDKIFSTYLNI